MIIPCPDCNGKGYNDYGDCNTCGGEGEVAAICNSLPDEDEESKCVRSVVKLDDISPNWNGSTAGERRVLSELLHYEATPFAIIRFADQQHLLSDYWYWFTLGTLWVSYSGRSDLELWRKLLCSSRSKRQTSLMKPSEWVKFKDLPSTFTAYRAHRPNETTWISYTIDRELAEQWAEERGGYVRTYRLKRSDCLALFLRRGEQEILMLDPNKARAADTSK
jgi:hypothetical protein